MKYFAFLLCFTLQFSAENFAQDVCGARMAALSGSAITQVDAFSGFNNLSASAQFKGVLTRFMVKFPMEFRRLKTLEWPFYNISNRSYGGGIPILWEYGI